MSVSHISISELDKIDLNIVNKDDLPEKKEELLTQRIQDIVNPFYDDFSAKRMYNCIRFSSGRSFFVKVDHYLVSCGVYRHHDNDTYDYLLYSKKDGFYAINGCVAPGIYGHHKYGINMENDETITTNTTPTIYHRSSGSNIYEKIEYGKVYSENDFEDVLVKCSTTPDELGLGTNVVVFQNSKVILSEDGVTDYSELGQLPDYVLYTKIKKEKNTRDVPIDTVLADMFSRTDYNLLMTRNDISNTTNYTMIAPLMAFVCGDQRYRCYDDQNIYYYVGLQHIKAFDVIMKICAEYGSIEIVPNLFSDDRSLNYQLSFSRSVPRDILSFVTKAVFETHELYPTIYGCPIHDVCRLICQDCPDSPYERPFIKFRNKKIAADCLDIIRKNCPGSSDAEIIKMLAEHYGIYGTSSHKIWDYLDLNIYPEYYPVSLESILGEKINRDFKYSLENSTYPVKWKSEYRLFDIIHSYYSDAIFQYTAPWLEGMRIDIYIPSLRIAIEYQGKQHYEDVGLFNAEYAQKRDEVKRIRCAQQGIKVIDWKYTKPVSIATFIQMMHKNKIDLPMINNY